MSVISFPKIERPTEDTQVKPTKMKWNLIPFPVKKGEVKDEWDTYDPLRQLKYIQDELRAEGQLSKRSKETLESLAESQDEKIIMNLNQLFSNLNEEKAK
jgi:hypothetical protein